MHNLGYAIALPFAALGLFYQIRRAVIQLTSAKTRVIGSMGIVTISLLLLQGLTGCNKRIDLDEDGYTSEASGGSDCNDSNAHINPRQRELCNGLDDNCNGDIDEGFANSDDSDDDGIPDCLDSPN